jgi:hypothetical protein
MHWRRPGRMGSSSPGARAHQEKGLEMTRKLKGLGLALAAMFALSAIAAGAAQAEKPLR